MYRTGTGGRPVQRHYSILYFLLSLPNDLSVHTLLLALTVELGRLPCCVLPMWLKTSTLAGGHSDVVVPLMLLRASCINKRIF